MRTKWKDGIKIIQSFFILLIRTVFVQFLLQNERLNAKIDDESLNIALIMEEVVMHVCQKVDNNNAHGLEDLLNVAMKCEIRASWRILEV